MAAKMPKKDAKELVKLARTRFKRCVEHDQENRDNYRENMRFTFVPGEQWEDEVKRARGDERPCREFNETRVKVKSVINHMRANRPMAKFIPVEEGDVETAEVYEAIWLNVWNNSKADNISDSAAEQQVAGGMGAWRVVTEYQEGSVDQQDICIKWIPNPLCLWPDYSCKEQDKSDAKYWFLATKITKEEREEKYGDREILEFEAGEVEQDDPLFDGDDGVWVAEYWVKQPITQTLCLLSDGRTVDKAELTNEVQVPNNITIIKEREVKSHKIVSYILSGDSVLEGPTEFASKQFPFVIVYGEFQVIDGKPVWYGLTHHMKDAQRAHNETMTGVYETVAASPQAKYWTTPEQAKGFLSQWKEAFVKNLPAMFYNPDVKAPGPPPRVGGAEVPVALMQASQMSSDSLNSVSGVFDTSLENVSTGTSGRALNARMAQQQVSTYNFSDNMVKAKERTARIVMDMIPKIFDTQRAIRVLGKDGGEKWVNINVPQPDGSYLNDLSRGRYDLSVTQGPNVQTQRQETAEFYERLMQALPQQAPLFADVAVRNMDIPGADQVAERLKATLPPNIQQAIQSGKPIDPQAMAMMQQAEQAMALVQEQGAQIQQAVQQAQSEKAMADKASAKVAVDMANVRVAEAELNQQIAEFKTMVAETQAQLVQQQNQQTEAQGVERDNMVAQLQQALAEIQDAAAALAQMQAEQIAALQAQTMQSMEVAAAHIQPRGNKVVSMQRDGKVLKGRVVTLDEAGNQIGVKNVELTRAPGGYQGAITETVQ